MDWSARTLERFAKWDAAAQEHGLPYWPALTDDTGVSPLSWTVPRRFLRPSEYCVVCGRPVRAGGRHARRHHR